MSTPKRSGSRDISDLKARLGLKKKAPTAAQPIAVPPPAGVVPPPSPQTGSVPVPPGVAPPPQQAYVPQQVVPDAAEDPFGAMNAMAANQAAVATAAPPPVFVNDGGPVASVEKKGGAATYAKIAGFIIGPLILGIVIGQIGNSAKNYNRTISDSKKIRADVEGASVGLLELQSVLQVAQERGPKNKEGKPWYKRNDEKLTKELGELKPIAYDPEVVYKSFIYDLPPEISERVFLFYTELNQLKKMLKEHLKKSPKNAAAIAAAHKKMAGFNPNGFAGLVTAPTSDQAAKGIPAMIRVVQLGLPICESGGKPTSEGCKGVPQESQYRLSETGNWGTKKVVGAAAAAPDGSLVLINPQTPFFMGILKGGEASVAEASYMERIGAIHNQVNDLVELRTFILKVLNNKAGESTKFTFFM